MTMTKPLALTSFSFNLNEQHLNDVDDLKQRLMNLVGVDDVSIFLDDKIAYMKIDKKLFKEESLTKIFA